MAFQPPEKEDHGVISETTKKMYEEMKRKKKLDQHRQKFDTPTFTLKNEKQNEIRIQNKLLSQLKERFITEYGESKLNAFVAAWTFQVTGLDVGHTLYLKPALLDFYEAKKYSDNPFEEAIKLGRRK